SSTALAAAGSSSWGTPLRSMRLVFGSISMVTVLAGITLPQTTTFNFSSPDSISAANKQKRLYVKAPLTKIGSEAAGSDRPGSVGYESHSFTLPSITTSKISLQSAIDWSTIFGSSLRCGMPAPTAFFSAGINSLNCWSNASVLGAGSMVILAYVYSLPLFGSGNVRPIFKIKASISSLYCWRATAFGRRFNPQNMYRSERYDLEVPNMLKPLDFPDL